MLDGTYGIATGACGEVVRVAAKLSLGNIEHVAHASLATLGKGTELGTHGDEAGGDEGKGAHHGGRYCCPSDKSREKMRCGCECIDRRQVGSGRRDFHLCARGRACILKKAAPAFVIRKEPAFASPSAPTCSPALPAGWYRQLPAFAQTVRQIVQLRLDTRTGVFLSWRSLVGALGTKVSVAQ